MPPSMSNTKSFVVEDDDEDDFGWRVVVVVVEGLEVSSIES